MRSALSALNVVELASGVAGGYCGKLFADLGSDVVKVELPGGDQLRHLPDGPVDSLGLFRGGAFLHLNTNKTSTVLDPARDEDRMTLVRLVERADLVIESSGGCELETWGATWEQLHERAPRVSLVRVSGFGRRARTPTTPGRTSSCRR